MPVSEIPIEPIENVVDSLFEDVPKTAEGFFKKLGKGKPVSTIPSKPFNSQPPPQFKTYQDYIPITKFDHHNPKHAIKLIIPLFLGLLLIWFGLTTTGSYFEPASRFGDVLAVIWYGYQLGTLLAIVGGILVYDAVKRTGYIG